MKKNEIIIEEGEIPDGAMEIDEETFTISKELFDSIVEKCNEYNNRVLH